MLEPPEDLFDAAAACAPNHGVECSAEPGAVCNGAKHFAALRCCLAGLYVHRNTMARRLRRTEDVLHVELANAEASFRLQLALRVHHIVISSGMHIDK